MDEMSLRVMKSIFDLSGDIEENIYYEPEDIAEYARMDTDAVRQILCRLYDAGYLGECMNIGNEGYETLFLNQRGRTAIGVE